MSKATARTRARSKKPAIDQITTEVISHRLLAASEEMLATLVKTAYSPNIKERRDCSVGIFDVRSNLIALSAIGPIHLSSLMGLVDNVLKRHPLDGLAPGDCFMTNDPYVGGGSHLPDITLVTPVFVDGRVVGFVTNLAHHSDIGGRVAGSESSDCTSIFQEGLRIPPVRLVAGGTLLQDIFDFLLLNSRTPREREGDIKAQLATNAIGVERLTEVLPPLRHRDHARRHRRHPRLLGGARARRHRGAAGRGLRARGVPRQRRPRGPAGAHGGQDHDQGGRHRLRLHRHRPAGAGGPQPAADRHARRHLLRGEGAHGSGPAPELRLLPGRSR